MLGQGPADRTRAEGMDPIHVTAHACRTDSVRQTSVAFGEQSVGAIRQCPLVMTG